ncbi:G-protein coupled receptor 84-like [Hemiscyllium ocellatum]|uniref:G-protein coupled receptor 84-like n=1 Tax=Hemiscyllium ocellatum TaxID=170820 RepID=UPI00296646E3|nr:G-protein coupled receptor 84-like [Hemiscyllium ocellatum]XP_060678358.1 G-protein coupled receptor 84-like [Hemiscyllium ocellatum]
MYSVNTSTSHFFEGDDLFSPNATCHPDVRSYRYFGASLGLAVTLVGTAGNVMTLLAFAAEPRLRHRFNLLILNLTVADLLYCGFLQPVTSATFLRNGWSWGPTACRAVGLLIFVANAVSIFNLVLIAGSRYALIANPHAYERVFQRRTMPFFIALPWALGLALFGPLWHIYVFLPAVCTCSFHRSMGKPYTTILMFFMFVLGLGCIGVFYYLIDRRVKAASRALKMHQRGGGRAGGKDGSRAALDHSSSQGTAADSRPQALSDLSSSPGTGAGSRPQALPGGNSRPQAPPDGDSRPQAPPDGSSRPQANPELSSSSSSCRGQRGKGRPRAPDSGYGDEASRGTEGTSVADEESTAGPRQGEALAAQGGGGGGCRGGVRDFRKVTRMCFAMFLVYVTCYMPFCVLHVLDANKRFPVLLHMVAGNFTWLNSCVNPVLYAVMNRQFRDAYRGVLLKAYRLCFCRR